MTLQFKSMDTRLLLSEAVVTESLIHSGSGFPPHISLHRSCCEWHDPKVSAFYANADIVSHATVSVPEIQRFSVTLPGGWEQSQTEQRRIFPRTEPL